MSTQEFSTNSAMAHQMDVAIGKNIRSIRKIRGLTLAQTADRFSSIAGITVSASIISAWERGTRRICASNLIILAKALQCADTTLADVTGISTKEAEEYNMSERSRETLRYAIFNWDGDMHALIELMRLYMMLPPQYREDVSFNAIHHHDQALQAGDLLQDLDVDAQLLENAWRVVVRRAAQIRKQKNKK